MFYPNKPFLQSLFIFVLFLLPMAQAASGEPLQMQTQMVEANEKIATLASDHQRITRRISALQTSLNTAHQEISDLKSQSNQLVETNAGTQRTANGHGRGGR